ncbi:MAG: hypothetical protein LBH28_00790 [Oscillospiraceae bacterium]|jgi:hypothetical protein|nr:hypothetical protein [Oscillospiraceae bacterium]
MKKIISLLFFTVLLTSLAACGGKDNAKNDPNLGLWVATTAEIFGESVDASIAFENGFTIELKSGGKCALNVDGEKGDSTWTLKDGVFAIKGNDFTEMSGTLANGKLTLVDLMGSGMTLIFYKEGSSSGAASTNAATGAIGDMLGEYVCTGWEVGGVRTDDGAGEWLKLESAARGIVQIAGNEYPFDWSISGNKMTIKEDVGITYTATYENGVITLDTGMLYFFEKAGTFVSSNGHGDTAVGTISEALAWWDGEWYGYWTVYSADETYKNYEGGIWDCYAVIDANADNTAVVYLWDDDIELGSVEIQIEPDAGGIMGGATSEGGVLFDSPVKHADWLIYPFADYYGNETEDMIGIDARFKDSDGDTFEYKICLRPWGMKWNDIPEGEWPPGYEDWYVGDDYCDYPSMLDALTETTLDGEPVYIHSALGGGSGSRMGDERTEGTSDTDDDANNIAANSGGAVVLDLTNEELKAIWEEFKNSGPWSEITYERVVELFGVEGGLVDRDLEKAIEYEWYASDDGSLIVQFDKATGEFNSSALNKYGRPD